jgi:His/Glu/Gln/Arg/opine family amino acid ABC transporter permease subunit
MNFNYTFNWLPIWQNRGLLLEGFVMTVELSFSALIVATLLGLFTGTISAVGNRAGRLIASTWVDLMRNVPLLIHMYIWYMALSFLQIPAFFCALLALSIYSSAYVSEIVSAGIQSLPVGQSQAAYATGLTTPNVLRLIIYPQVLRRIAPSLGGVFSQLIKDSSLASVIAVAEITYQAGALDGQTFRTFEIYITILVLYLLLVTSVTQSMNLIFWRKNRNRAKLTPAATNTGVSNA